MSQTFSITAEEKALLDAAKKVCQKWGHVNGELITQKAQRREAEALLIEQIQLGRVVVDGQYLCDTTH
jgi:hypothetical protein